MPTSSRAREFFGAGPMRSNRLLVPAYPYTGFKTVLENLLFGGNLTAVADPTYARIRVDLYWPGIRLATITRVHADGSTYDVRGGDPATMCTAWARWDYEAPLDQAVTYRATSTERTGSTATTGPVTLSSGGRHWLKSVAKPSLNLAVTIDDRGDRNAPAHAAKIEPPTRPDAIYVYQVRAKDKGTIALYAADLATERAIRAVLAAGGPVMLQYPAVAGGESLYLMVDAVGYRPKARITVDPKRSIALPFDSIARPPGAAEGGPSNSYAAAATKYQTYNQLAAAYPSYIELSMSSF